jgi:hypothetical protein
MNDWIKVVYIDKNGKEITELVKTSSNQMAVQYAETKIKKGTTIKTTKHRG